MERWCCGGGKEDNNCDCNEYKVAFDNTGNEDDDCVEDRNGSDEEESGGDDDDKERDGDDNDKVLTNRVVNVLYFSNWSSSRGFANTINGRVCFISGSFPRRTL